MQVSRRSLAGKRVDDLLARPPGAGFIGDVEMHDAASPVLEDDEHVEQAERRCGNHEEVDRRGTGQVDRAEPEDEEPVLLPVEASGG